MQLTSDRQLIYDDLIADRIDWETAASRLAILPPPWKSSEWRSNREQTIRSSCETCGSTIGIMVAQHSYHPPKISEIVSRLAGNDGSTIQHLIEQIKAEMAERYALILPEQRESCPKCGSLAVRWNKTHQLWKCSGSTGEYRGLGHKRAVCGNEFAGPVYVMEYSAASKKSIAKLNQEAFEKASSCFSSARQEWWNGVCSKYGKEAVIESLKWSSWYLSLKGTKTLCKKCAFLEDKDLITAKQFAAFTDNRQGLHQRS